MLLWRIHAAAAPTFVLEKADSTHVISDEVTVIVFKLYTFHIYSFIVWKIIFLCRQIILLKRVYSV